MPESPYLIWDSGLPRRNRQDARIHTVKLGPYLRYDVSLKPSQLEQGENALEIKPSRLIADLAGKINLVEIELSVRYG